MKLQCAKCGTDVASSGFCPDTKHRNERVVVATGETLNGNNNTYEIQKVLSAKGGTALTYLANDSLGNAVVVKELVYNPDPTIQADNEIRFEREAIFLASLSSKFLPKGLDRFDEAGHKFFVQTYIAGQDLFEYVKLSGIMTADEVLEIGAMLCEALGLLHDFKNPQNNTPDAILHRDIKPDNVMLTAHTKLPVLIDFGSAATTATATVGQTVMMPGTPGYISQSRMQGTENETDDLFALAYTLIYLMTGVEPTVNNANRDTLLKALPSSWQRTFDFATQDVVLPGNKKGDVGFRPKNWQDFRAQLVQLMSAAKQANYGVNTPVAAPATPVQAVYNVAMSHASTFMPDPNSYSQPLQGRITLNGQPAGGLLLTPIISDIGGKSTANGPGQRITIGTLGEFTLAIDDCTVPIAVNQRDIELVFTDSTGAEVHKLTVTIHRPRTAMAASAGSAFVAAVRAPFDAFTNWRQNRAAINAAVQQAKLNQNTQLTAAQTQLASAQANANQAIGTARQNAKNQIASQKVQAQSSPDYVSPLGHVWNFLKPLLYILIAIGVGYVLYLLGVYLYARLIEVDWNVWGPYVAKIAGIIVAVALIIYLTPKLYRAAKRYRLGSKIGSAFASLWGILKNAPNVLRAFIAGGLIMATCFGLIQNQTWLILFPLGFLSLCYKWKSAQGWFLGIVITVTWEAIALAICLAQIKQFLKSF